MSPVPITTETTAAVDAAITSRRAVRAFLPTPVPRETVQDILRVAARAPSGTNTQPWKVTVLTGAAREGLTAKIMAAFDDPQELERHQEEYAYYPPHWKSPYLERRRQIGMGLYGLLGIGKGEHARMHAQFGRNYSFFGAPVGMMFSIDRDLVQGSWLDYGTFLQSVMVAARGRGLDTCPQQAFARFHRLVAEHVGMPDGDMLVCGMSLGWADPDAAENALVTEREAVEQFTRFLE